MLVTDEWQHRDLGSILTEYCVEIARKSGIRKVIAETTRDNRPMVSVFRKLEFNVHFNEDGTVSVFKDLV